MAEPLWKQALAKTATPEARAKSNATRTRWKTVDDAMYDELDAYGARAFFSDFMRSAKAEDKRAFLQYLGRRMPQHVETEITAALTVVVKTSIGTEIPIKLGQGFPRDASTGRRLPVVPHSVSDPGGDPPVEDAEVIEGERGA